MALIKSLSFLMLMSALLVAASAAFGGRKAQLAPASAPAPEPAPWVLPPGVDFGFVPMNTKDPKAIQLAQYAIDEYNKANGSKLAFAAVFEALYTESEKGTNYGLVVAATDEKKQLNDYEVTVWVDKADDADKKVTSFEQNE